MAEITLKTALDLIQAGSITERSQGLTDIKHVFRHNRNNASIEQLSDVTYNRIFSELFRWIETEKTTYNRAKAPNTRTAAANRLTAISGALRLSIEAGIPALRLKTVRLTLEHVSQTMRMPNGDFCHPIALDYAKCIRAILSHQPHLTHLPPDEWEQQLDFTMDCIQTADREEREYENSPVLDRTSVATNMITSSYRSSRTVVKESGNSQNIHSSTRQVAEEMIACVRLLTAPPNAPLIAKSTSLIRTLIECLRSSTNIVRLQRDCFGAVNNILLRIRTENITLAREITPNLIRLIKNFWSHKSSPLRDELLVTIVLLRPYIHDVVSQEQTLTFQSELANLHKAISAEYCKRTAQDQLRLDDLRFEIGCNNHTGKIATSIFRLRCAGTRAEQCWFILDTLASLRNCLIGELGDVESDQDSDDGYGEDLNKRPRKRQRTESRFEDILFPLVTDDGAAPSRLCNFQVLAFLAQQRALTSKQIAQAVDKITAAMSEGLGAGASWAFLALTSCASQSASTSSILSARWSAVWQLAVRAFSDPSSCRAASYTLFILLKLCLIPQASSSELVHTITTAMDLNGPTIFTDSVTLLLTVILQDAAQQSPGASSATADSIVRWWTRTYVPSKYDERVYASYSSAYEVSDIRSLIGACLNKASSQSLTLPFPVWDALSSTWLHCENEQELLSYLLLRPAQATGINDALFKQPRPFSGSSRTDCEALVLTHMTSELAQINDKWSKSAKGRSRNVSIDALTSLCKACCFMTSLAYEASLRDSKRQSQLQRQVEMLLKSLSAFASKPSCGFEERDIILSVFSTMFSNWRSLEDRDFRWPSKGEKSICKTISDFMRTVQEPKDSYEEDIMDIDESNDSQDSRHGSSNATMPSIIDDLSVAFSKEALRSGAFCYAHAIIVLTSDTCFLGLEDDPDNGEPDDEIEQPGTVMVDWIITQPEKTILASRKIISGLPKLNFALDAQDVERLLDYLMGRILGSYVYNRSEVAIGAVVDVMSSLLSVWSDPAHKKLFDLGIEIYEWFTNIALPNGMISPNVQQKLATLLLNLCHFNTDYAKGSEAPSVRTTLFVLLKTGSITLQYHLAGKIPSLFNLFVLSTHHALFDDLQSSLPAHAEWIEGIAMRLMFLAKLASTWHSLLRQCVYYMFDAGGRVDSSLGHATRCIQELAQSLPAKSPRRLFSLFAPQLLHTWLEGQHLSEIPFAAFQYQSLAELFQHNHQEICAQSVMRGDKEALNLLAKELRVSTTELVRRSFAKCVAYAISRDVCSTSNSSTVETQLRDMVGTKEDFKRLTAQQYATILGQFFLCMQHDDLQDSWLERRDGYSAAYEVLLEIKRYSCSERKLPDAQEPSFRSKYLCDQIERLCRRASLEPTRPWDTSSFTLAVRMLLDAMDESLGSLHACLMIRRLRILIAMGGQVALVGFPLEMLILSLRPFINDSVCAEDVIGILHYLFDKGQHHLQTKFTFLSGTITMLVLQMRKRARTRQDSTTQESQHQATIQKMIDFQGWLVRYFSTSTQSQSSVAYDILINSLRNLTLPGNARQDSPESGLLLFLLDQWFAKEPLCSRPDCLEALHLLSEKFELPATVIDDCLAADDVAIRYAQPLLAVLRAAPMSQDFTVWAARVLGRAYVSTGLRPSEMRHARLDEIESLECEGILKSENAIATRLCELLYSKHRHEAGLAEYTLRKISSSLHNPADAMTFESLLAHGIEPVVQEGNYGYCPAAAEDPLITTPHIQGVRGLLEAPVRVSINEWTTSVAVAICQWAAEVPILPALISILHNIDGLAQELLPIIIHLLLASDLGDAYTLRAELSEATSRHLADSNPASLPIQQLLLKVILYLQSHPMIGETTKADRLQWLDIDLIIAAKAAARCEMPTCALMLAELNLQPLSPRRASRSSMSQVRPLDIPDDLLLSIFKQFEEPDSFYGVQQAASLQSVLERLDHESDGFGSLMFRSAKMDSNMRLSHQLTDTDVAGLTRSLSTLNLNSLSFALLSHGFANHLGTSVDMLTAARTLQQWDVSLPESSPGEDAATFSIFQELNRAIDLNHVSSNLSSAIVRHLRREQLTTSIGLRREPPVSWFSTLATLTEIGEVMSCVDYTDIRSKLSNLQSRQSWMRLADYDQVLPILSNRHTLFGVLAKNQQIQKLMHLNQKQVRRAEIECLLDGSRIAREHSRLQVSLSAVSSLNVMMEECRKVDLNVETAVKLETASVLWDSKQSEVSIKMLRDILAIQHDKTEDIPVGEPGLLAQLGHQLALARLERPEYILENYLTPAFERLGECREGTEAGKVFFEFASFCDSELFNPVSIEHVNRVSKLRQQKADEVSGLELMLKEERRADRKNIQRQLDKANQWYKIDDAEWQRLKKHRDLYLQQSLRFYLLTLQASDDHDICVLRFFALWLENAEEIYANKIVSKHLLQVPSWKFVRLMNQLMSRLEDDTTTFQGTLKSMIVCLCLSHPYHSMQHLFAAHRMPISNDDAAAMSRYHAARGIVQKLRDDPDHGELLNSLFHADRCYDALARARPELKENTNKIATKDLREARKVAQTVPPLKIPPATIYIPLRPDCDYSNVPIVTRCGSSVSKLGGLSSPALLTIYATDGKPYRQIFKSGNDDLRQDAIMEQVFEEVSKMLRNHKATRQRDLKVRTYKVIPLSANSGIIEFVPDSVPLGEFLRPAHWRYYPRDQSDSKAREAIRSVQKETPDRRLSAFRKVCDHTHPVLRHFFFERFHDPDEWFAKRTAYTRTTATISMLGYVLGLGDRHCQNILLDEQTGEVVHIDLGVAFEAGRVLPIPELVPFRLTRDVVDGMGVTRTEGVFRRCCEFTVDALRADRDRIMTLLNVLRYDPLYTWTMSPLRAKRLQAAQDAAGGEGGNGGENGDVLVEVSSKRKDQEAGEADRALSIVEKKLSTTLSTAATVNELIQQATDERHLAMLFGGWSAYY